jgi:hypothetical protein
MSFAVVAAAMLAIVPLTKFVTIGANKNVMAVFFAAILIGIGAVSIFRQQSLSLGQKQMMKAAGISLVLVLLFAVLQGLNFDGVFGFAMQQSTLVAIFAYVGVGISAYVVATTKHSQLFFLGSLLVAGTFAAIITIISRIFSFDANTVSSDNTFSTFVLFGALFVIALSLAGCKDLSQRMRIGVTVSVLILGFALFLSGSNILLISTGLFGAMAFATVAISFRRIQRGVSVGVVGLLVASLLVVVGSIDARRFVPEDSKLFATQEIRPSLSTTAHVAFLAVTDNPFVAITGSGPNSFSKVWDKYMPEQVARSDFWDSDFSYGSNFFLTLAIEIGMPLTLGLLLVGILSVILSTRRYFSESDGNSAPVTYVLLFMLFWAFIFTPDTLFILFSSIFFGFTLGGMDQSSGTPTKRYLKSIAFVLLLVSAVLGIFFSTRYIRALDTYGRGVETYKQGGDALIEATGYLEKSVAVIEIPIVLRSLSQVHKNTALLMFENSREPLSNDERELAISKLDRAVFLADQARQLSGENYRTQLMFGEAQLAQGLATSDESLVKRGLQGYLNAEDKAPNRPLPYFRHGQALFMVGRFEDAQDVLRKALEKRPQYKEAQTLLEYIDTQL